MSDLRYVALTDGLYAVQGSHQVSDEIQGLKARLNETGSLRDAKALREAQARAAKGKQ